jgi:tetratricopeptide (TPR) repeat protein
MTMKRLALLLLLATSMPSAYAADTGGSAPAPSPTPMASATPTPTPTPTPRYEVATPTPTPTQSVATSSLSSDLASIRGLIANKNYSAALTALKGYSARNLKQYKAAGTYYAKALRVNPNHLGALEYQGELFVLTKKISAAKKNLAKLKTLCGVNCEEYLELKQAIGNK